MVIVMAPFPPSWTGSQFTYIHVTVCLSLFLFAAPPCPPPPSLSLSLSLSICLSVCLSLYLYLYLSLFVYNLCLPISPSTLFLSDSVFPFFPFPLSPFLFLQLSSLFCSHTHTHILPPLLLFLPSPFISPPLSPLTSFIALGNHSIKSQLKIWLRTNSFKEIPPK